MKAKASFYIAFVLGITGSPVYAQVKSEVYHDIYKVESGLMPATRFVGEPLEVIPSHENVIKALKTL